MKTIMNLINDYFHKPTPEAAWEDRELGATKAYVRKVSLQRERLVDEGLGLQMISLRLQKDLIDALKQLAQEEGIGYQPYIPKANDISAFWHLTCACSFDDFLRKNSLHRMAMHLIFSKKIVEIPHACERQNAATFLVPRCFRYQKIIRFGYIRQLLTRHIQAKKKERGH
jgi:hypothetical protein